MSRIIINIFDVSKEYFTEYGRNVSQLEPKVITASLVVLLTVVLNFVSSDPKKAIFSLAKWIPGLSFIIRRRINKAIADVHQSIHGSSRVVYEKKLPTDGLSADKVLQRIRKYKAYVGLRWNEGFASGSVYPRMDGLGDMASKVFKEFIWSNPLHPDLFPDVRRMEAEVIRMCLNMFHGDEEACGTVNSGGTESIMLACLAYRELARSKGIQHPVMLIPESAHPAFDKAAHYFNMEIGRIPVDPVSLKVDVKAMRRAISKNTCMLVGSAPGFPHGIIDPIADIAALGTRYGIPVHVDCCLGGFLLPFMDAADFYVESFDFRLAGVTTISCDTHKYGFAAKGTSVLMYRHKSHRSMQFFTQPDWSGGVYASPTFAGSRPGALIAVCWATMMHYGQRGYVESTRRIVKTTRFIAERLQKIPGIVLMGDPQVNVVAFGSNTFDIYRLSHMLSELPNGRGWCLNNLQLPAAVHLCVTDLHTVEGRAEGFLRDVSNAAAELSLHPHVPAHGTAAMYGLCATIPDRSIVSEVAKGFLDACYDTPEPKTEEKK